MLSRWWRRLRSSLERPLGRHALALLALTFVHLMVFARSLFREGEGPAFYIPWDFLDSYHRFLIFTGDAFRAHTLPLWYPYGEGGIPFFLNPQNQLWSPVTWLVSGLFGYDVVVAQRQVILTLLVGGIGCYVLAASLWEGTCAALFAAVAYNFTAARFANCEHLDIVNAFAILPWLLWAMRRLAQGRRGSLVILAFLAYLFLVSGYPGVVLLSPLWLGGWALHLCWDLDGPARKRFLGSLAGAALLAVILGAGYWLPLAAYRSAFERSEPLTVQQALAQSLTLKDLSHLIFGVRLDAPMDGLGNDPSMRGLYFGILAVPMAVAAVIYRRDRLIEVLAGGAFFALLMSLGSSFFVRTALHTWVHLLNLSRFPAVDSRAVAILGAALLAGAGVDVLLREPALVSRFLARAYVGLLGCLAVGLFLIRHTLFEGLIGPDFADRVVTPVISQCLWLAAAAILYRRLGPGRRMAWALVVLSALDVGTQVHLNYFAAGRLAPPTFWADMKKEHVSSFDPAQALLPRTQFESLIDPRANRGYTTKSFFLGTYGPFKLRGFSGLITAGFTGWLVNGKRVVAFAGPIPDAGPAFVAAAAPVEFSIDTYLPDRVVYNVNLAQAQTLVFNEVYFPGWKASVDGGRSVEMGEAAHGLRALSVPAGPHRVVTRFSPGFFWVGAALSLCGWLAAIAALAIPLLRRRRARMG